jgi:hypothetical protein
MNHRVPFVGQVPGNGLFGGGGTAIMQAGISEIDCFLIGFVENSLYSIESLFDILEEKLGGKLVQVGVSVRVISQDVPRGSPGI